MFGDFNLSLPQFTTLASLVFVLSLGWFVLSKDYKNTKNRLFFLITLIFGLWEFCTFRMLSTKSDEEVIFWDRLLYYAVVFLPVIEYHFSLFFTKFNQARKRLLYSGYVVSLMFAFTVPTNYFVNEVFRYSLGVHTRAQIIHHFFIAFFFFYVFTVLYSFIKNYKEQVSKIEKDRSIYFFISFAALNLIAGIAYLPAYGFAVYPIALAAPIIFTILITYAMVSYRLMDIKFVLRSSTVYLSSLILTLIPALSLKYFFDRVLPEYAYWIDFAIIVFSLSVFPYFKGRIYRFANKYFFSSLYDAKQVVKDLSDRLGSTLEPGKIYEAINHILGDALHMKAICFITCGAKNKDYIVSYNDGFKIQDKIQKNELYDKIFKDFIAGNNILITDELRNAKNIQAKNIVKALDKLDIKIIAPLMVKDKPIGAIVLSSKEAGDSYNNEDVDLLKIVGSQTAIALENALLYEETKKFNIKLVKEVDKATSELKGANEELKKLDQAKSDFISIASHQLRTPLTVIKGYGSMMLEGSFGKMPDIIEENMKKIYDSNERLINLVEDLLNISRIESGRLQFNWEVGQLEEMVGSVVEELTPNAIKKGLTFKYSAPKKALPPIKLDKTKLRQVAINLIDNSIKYTDKGGLTVTLTQEGNKLKFCVADTGMGISPDGLQNLFKKFSRGEKTSILHTEGTGLGLYVGKMMVEAHGGRIWAESDGEKKGSRFCFEIPVASSASSAKTTTIQSIK